MLVFTLLAMLALELLAHGALLLAREQVAASSAGTRLLQATAGARSAVMEAIGVGATGLDSVPVARALTGGGPRFADVATRWRLRRLGREAWLAEGWARVGTAPWEAREARLLWRMDAGARVAAFTAAVEVGDPDLAQVGGALRGIPAHEECPGAGATLDSILPGGLVGRGTAPEIRLSQGGLGEVGWEAALDVLPVLPAARGTPASRDSAGVCVVGSWNWGDPDDPSAPCGGHRPWSAAPGDLSLEAGEGQGVLVALGDVAMAGTRFAGVVLARGDVHLTAGAELRGMVLASGSITVDAASVVEGSACAALLAFQAAPRAVAALRLARGVGWLPVF